MSVKTGDLAGFSQLGPNAGYARELFDLYRVDRSLVERSWAEYFDSLSHPDEVALSENGNVQTSDPGVKEASKVNSLIDCYRSKGHFKAGISPLLSVLDPRPEVVELGLEYHGLGEDELTGKFECHSFKGGGSYRLSELLFELKQIYCGSIGFEYFHIRDPERRTWLQERIENRPLSGGFNDNYRRHLLERLIDAEIFEAELHKKYVGQKRFSLEGGESLIPLLDVVLEGCSQHGIREVLIGMPHRGRLTVLAKILGKPLGEIFTEFEDQSVFSSLGSGDVKYHLGFKSIHIDSKGEEVKLKLVSNPSHLEFVNPVVEGIVRAKQDIHYKRKRVAVLPLLLHGDSAVIGQGIVAETLNFSDVDGYRTGGTFHIVVNNQIGFTTSPVHTRSSPYCTDVMRAFDLPVFHVNAEDPEAVCWATAVALEYRCRFNSDVVIDLNCYRKYGHNEADDPSYTQPLMYSEIKGKDKISVIYRRTLEDEGVITENECKELEGRYRREFQKAYDQKGEDPAAAACAVHGRLKVAELETGVPEPDLKHIADTLVDYPVDFTPHPKLIKIINTRVERLKAGSTVDWAFVEALAFGSLVLDGIGVRLSGQDSGRGTFSQRHLMLTDYKTGATYLPLGKLTDEAEKDVRFEVYNSPLSEAGVLGFEFGYGCETDDELVIWEAQFGDFANGAQVIIDQFISASEAKWGQRSGLVMLLPHGYEGQGPEHSSARLERYLQLCAEGNMQVCNPSAASQYFHLLRRQGMQPIRRPLVIMTPKSLLRSADAGATINDLTSGVFHPLLDDEGADPKLVENVFFMSGKICYDIKKGIENQNIQNAAIVRIEQLFPFPHDEIGEVIRRYRGAKRYFWVQEEPANMGAWCYVKGQFSLGAGLNLSYIGRPESASTATGSARRHHVEQEKIVREVVRQCSQDT